MAKHKIIFVSQEIAPYLPSAPNAQWGKALPQAIQGRKYEVRTFMPDFGSINERRNQLHEVIRLSGLNIPIADNDHPLVVKVASMQPSRIQVYFLDNDDYFQALPTDADPFGSNRPDNDERVIFFARGTMETAKKLQWDPAVVQVSGWISALVPLYLKRMATDSTSFSKTKIVYTLLPGPQPETLDPAFFDKLKAEGVKPSDLRKFKALEVKPSLLHKMAAAYSDHVVFQNVSPDPELTAYLDEIGKPWSCLEGEGEHAEAYDELYKSLMPKS